MGKPFIFGKKSLKNREGVHSELIEISDLALSLSPIDFGIPPDGGVRTAKRQNELFRSGKSLADGYLNASTHQTRNAIDFYAYVNGRGSWRPDHLAIVGAAYLQAAVMLGYQIKWGGFFKPHKKTNDLTYGWDMPHIQRLGR